MKITILTGVFYPTIHPRAFRSNELAKEFARQGHSVTVVNLRTVPDFDYKAYEEENNIKIINLGVFKESNLAKLAAKKSTYTWWGRKKRYYIEYLLNGKLFRYGPRIAADLDCLKGSDLVIALSTPFPVHYGYYRYVKKHGRDFVTILDSGDPFYYSKQTKRAIWFKYIEKNVYKHCDYLTIPTENAISLYSPIIPLNKIRIIPQGFNMKNVKLYAGSFEGSVKIAYAGVFYWGIRNPEFIFRALEDTDVDYEFYLFLRYEDARLEEVLQDYPNLKSRMRIKLCVPHDDLLYELSKMDFLINIENLSNTQMPSKLIDYGITRRPIFSCNKATFSKEKFENFLHRQYEGSYEINIADYDIEKIASQFVELYNNVIRK